MKSEKIDVIQIARSSNYQVMVTTGDPDLSDEFVEAFKGLPDPECCTAGGRLAVSPCAALCDRYDEMVEKFGMFYASEVSLGVKVYRRMTITRAFLENMERMEMGVKSSVDYGAGGVSLASKLSVTIQQQAKDMKDEKSVSQSWYIFGGDPSKATFDPENFDDVEGLLQHAATGRDNALPMSYKLIPISRILKAEKFPGLALFEEKRAYLIETMENVCVADGAACSFEDEQSESAVRYGDLVNLSAGTDNQDYSICIGSNSNQVTARPTGDKARKLGVEYVTYQFASHLLSVLSDKTD